MVVEVNSAALSKIIEDNSLVIVDFYAPWCGPCKILLPMFEGMSEELPAACVKVDVDAEPELAAKYNVMGVPTVVAIRDGEVVASGTGIPKITPIFDKVRSGTL